VDVVVAVPIGMAVTRMATVAVVIEMVIAVAL
jgi:hypothetical protein